MWNTKGCLFACGSTMILRTGHNVGLQSRMNSCSWHDALVHLTCHFGTRCALSLYNFKIHYASWPPTLIGAMACIVRLFLPFNPLQYCHGSHINGSHSFCCSRASNSESRSLALFCRFIFLRLLGMVRNPLVCLRFLWTLLCRAWSLGGPILCHRSVQFYLLLLPMMEKV